MADGPRGVTDVYFLSEAFQGETISHPPICTHQETAEVPMPHIQDCVGQAVSQGEDCVGLNTFRGHPGSLCHTRLHAIPKGFEEQQHQETEGKWKKPLSKWAKREGGDVRKGLGTTAGGLEDLRACNWTPRPPDSQERQGKKGQGHLDTERWWVLF